MEQSLASPHAPVADKQRWRECYLPVALKWIERRRVAYPALAQEQKVCESGKSLERMMAV